MKLFLCCLLAGVLVSVVLISKSVAGEATGADKITLDKSFEEVLNVFKENEEKILMEGVGSCSVVSKDGNRIKMKLKLPRKEAYFTLLLREDIDYENKTAVFISELVETDGFVQDQKTTIHVIEVNGKAVIKVSIYAKIPTVGNALIRLDIRRSLVDLAEIISRLL